MPDDHRPGWQVLLLLLVALPVLTLPAATIVVGLALFYLFERVTQGGLALANVVRRRQGKEERRVNRPKLSFRL